MQETRPVTYDWKSFSLANGASDYDVATEIAALFNNVPVAKNIVIFHNKEIGIKFNSTTMPKVTLPMSRSPFQSPQRFLMVKNIFLSNASGDSCTMEVFLW